MKLGELEENRNASAPFSISVRLDKNGNVERIDVSELGQALENINIVDDSGFNPREACFCDKHRTVTRSRIITLVMKYVQKRYPNLTKKALSNTEKSVREALKEVREEDEEPNEWRISCKYKLCREGTKSHPKAMFYPSKTETTPYCSKKCLRLQKKKYGWFHGVRPSGGYRKLWRKECDTCGKTVWLTKGRKNCEKCV